MFIPKGKRLIINNLDATKGISQTYISNPLNNLIISEDVTLPFTSTFKPVVENSSNVGLRVLTDSLKRTTGYNVGTQFKELGLQIWEKTEPLKVTVNIYMVMRTDAKEDVWEPAKELIKLALPTEETGGKGWGLIAPGPSVLGVFTATSANGLLIRIGNFIFKPCVVSKADPTFSSETDMRGYPISCKMVLTFETVYTATTNMIDNWK